MHHISRKQFFQFFAVLALGMFVSEACRQAPSIAETLSASRVALAQSGRTGGTMACSAVTVYDKSANSWFQIGNLACIPGTQVLNDNILCCQKPN